MHFDQGVYDAHFIQNGVRKWNVWTPSHILINRLHSVLVKITKNVLLSNENLNIHFIGAAILFHTM